MHPRSLLLLRAAGGDKSDRDTGEEADTDTDTDTDTDCADATTQVEAVTCRAEVFLGAAPLLEAYTTEAVLLQAAGWLAGRAGAGAWTGTGRGLALLALLTTMARCRQESMRYFVGRWFYGEEEDTYIQTDCR